MAATSGLSHTSVQRIWQAFGLQPHRSEYFKLSTDPQLSRRCATSSVSISTPDRALVLCVDEKTQIQALDRSQPMLPMARSGRAPDPRLPAAWNHVAVRRSRRRHWQGDRPSRRRTAPSSSGPSSTASIRRCPRSSTCTWCWTTEHHKTPSIQRWLLQHPRFHLHFTRPTLVDQPGRTLVRGADRKQLRRGVHRSTRAWRRHPALSRTCNDDPHPLCGSRPPMRSWPASNAFVYESPVQDTSLSGTLMVTVSAKGAVTINSQDQRAFTTPRVGVVRRSPRRSCG